MNIRSNTIKNLKQVKKLEQKIEEGSAKLINTLLENNVKSRLDFLINEETEEDEDNELPLENDTISDEEETEGPTEEEVEIVDLDDEDETPVIDIEDNEFWTDLEDTKDEEGVYDLTNSEDERVVSVLKRLRPGDDNIFVTKGEDNNELEVKIGDDEYVIEIELDEEMKNIEEEVLPHVGKDNKRLKRSTPYSDKEKFIKPDEVIESDYLVEMDLEDTLEDTVTNEVYDEETIQEITEHAFRAMVEPLTKKVAEKTVEEVSKIYESKYQKLKDEFEVYKKRYNELKQISEALYKSTQEVGIVNESLGEFVKIVIEHPTTEKEKRNIIQRLGEAKTSKDLKRITESIKRDLSNVNENKKLKIDENICVKKSDLIEESYTGDKALEPTLELMRKICY